MSGWAVPGLLVGISLAIASAICLSAGFFFVTSDARVVARSVASRPASIPAIPAVVEAMALDAEAVRRPLFHRNRRPIDEGAPAAANNTAAPGLDPGLTLRGVVINGANARAALQTSDAAPPTWAAVGDTIDRWTIEAIAPDRVRLRAGDEVSEIKLFEDG